MQPASPLSDQHRVLLWQTCAYADALSDAARTGQPVARAQNSLVGFLHLRLLPYLHDEERRLPAARLRDAHMLPLLVADHLRLRADVDNIEDGRTPRLLAIAADALVERLDRHMRREELWVTPRTVPPRDHELATWALPLLLTDEIELDALPGDEVERLVRQRLAWMRPGEVIHVESACDLHPVWRTQRRWFRDGYAWSYEETGPTRWRARITRRRQDDA